MINVKNLLLGIAIAIIFFMFSVYGTQIIYERPNYEDYCDFSYYPEKIGLASCNMSSELQVKMNECYSVGGTPRYAYDTRGCANDIACDFCNREYNQADEEYTKNLFLISLIIGIIVIIVSVIVIKVAAVSGGLMLGSLFFMIYGTTGYWRFMEDIFRFAVLGIVLFVLVWLAYYLSRKSISEIFSKKKARRKKRR